MPIWARTLWMWIKCRVQYIWCILAAIRNLSGWWCCEVGCCMWLLIKYMLLRLSVNMCVSIWVFCMVLMAMSIAFSFALRIFWYPSNLSNMWVLLLGLYIPRYTHRNIQSLKSWSLTSLLFRNPTLCCLLLMHVLQSNENIRQENLPMVMSLTMFWSAWTSFAFKCLRWRCESSSAASPVEDCTKLIASAPCTIAKFILYKLPSRDAIAMTLPSCAFTKHSFRLNCTFKPFDTCLFSESKLTSTWIRRVHLSYKFGWFFFSLLLLRG